MPGTQAASQVSRTGEYEIRLVKKKTRWNVSLYLLSPKILSLLNEVSLLPIAKCLKLAPAETSNN